MSAALKRSGSPPTDAAMLLEAVTELVRVAGDAALGYFDTARRARLAVERKDDGSPVTVADRRAESVAREWLEQRFPADGILGEEMGSVREGAARRWIIDPIDGTKSFVHGVPLWGTLVAVAAGETVLAGAINCAAAGELVAAAVGEGCWWNGARCHVSTEGDLSRATVLTTDEAMTALLSDPRGARDPEVREHRLRGWRALAEHAGLARSWGDAYGYLLVATARAEAMTDAIMAPWDTAALQPVITEAGGVFTDWDGKPTAFGGSSIATNQALAREARTILNGAGS